MVRGGMLRHEIFFFFVIVSTIIILYLYLTIFLGKLLRIDVPKSHVLRLISVFAIVVFTSRFGIPFAVRVLLYCEWREYTEYTKDNIDWPTESIYSKTLLVPFASVLLYCEWREYTEYTEYTKDNIDWPTESIYSKTLLLSAAKR